MPWILQYLEASGRPRRSSGTPQQLARAPQPLPQAGEAGIAVDMGIGDPISDDVAADLSGVDNG